MRRRIVFVTLFIQLILTSIVFAETAQITNGLNYLTSTQNTDGSWTSGEESISAAEEIIKTLSLLNQTSTSGYALALSWLQSQSLETTNHLADRIFVLGSAGTDGDLLISYLDDLVRAWGGYNDYIVNNLDTTHALQALKKINYTDQAVIQAAISYLLTNQNSDGGWGFEAGENSNVFMTATVVTALTQFDTLYDFQTPINNGAAFLMGKQNTDGGFGSSPSTAYETGLAMEALIASGVNISAKSGTPYQFF